MLKSDFLLYITDAAEAAAEKMNNALTKRIATRIVALFESTGDVSLIPSSISDVRKMKETGATLEEIQAELNKYLPNMQSEVKKAFTTAADEIARDNDRFTVEAAKEAGIDTDISTQELTQSEKTLLERAYDKTNGTLKNLTGTTAEEWQQEYIRVTDEAYWQATHGVSLNSAISDAIDEAAKYGSVVKYPSGHVDRIEVAVARAVRTGVNQAAGDISLARCAELGVSQVLVSSHLGARYTDHDEPANHMSWQGKVYDLDWTAEALQKYRVTAQTDADNNEKFSFLKKIREKLRKKKDRSAGDFVTITGYGTGEGLCGWNCRHSFSPYFKGINTNNTEQYDSDESKERYDNEQKQRSMERAMRDTKRQMNARKAAYEDATDEDLKETLREKYQAAREKYDKQVTAYNNFSKQKGLKTHYERLKQGR